jgi:hypothetical protein
MDSRTQNKPTTKQKEHHMRDLTTYELDAQLAEQLPARELMGRSCCRPYCGGGQEHSSETIVQGNSDNGNQSSQFGLVNVNNVGNGDGNVNVVL